MIHFFFFFDSRSQMCMLRTAAVAATTTLYRARYTFSFASISIQPAKTQSFYQRNFSIRTKLGRNIFIEMKEEEKKIVFEKFEAAEDDEIFFTLVLPPRCPYSVRHLCVSFFHLLWLFSCYFQLNG